MASGMVETMSIRCLIRRMFVRNTQRKRDLYVAFMNLKKAYDGVERDALWKVCNQLVWISPIH